MIVFHGSTEIIKKPDTEHSLRPLDFGKGFYVTTVKEQAEKWARRKAAIFEKNKAIVNKYEMSDNFTSLNKKQFDNDLSEMKAYPNYDQIAFITQKAIDQLLAFVSFEEV